jgi:hypothetical protein
MANCIHTSFTFLALNTNEHHVLYTFSNNIIMQYTTKPLIQLAGRSYVFEVGIPMKLVRLTIMCLRDCRLGISPASEY